MEVVSCWCVVLKDIPERDWVAWTCKLQGHRSGVKVPRMSQLRAFVDGSSFSLFRDHFSSYSWSLMYKLLELFQLSSTRRVTRVHRRLWVSASLALDMITPIFTIYSVISTFSLYRISPIQKSSSRERLQPPRSFCPTSCSDFHCPLGSAPRTKPWISLPSLGEDGPWSPYIS